LKEKKQKFKKEGMLPPARPDSRPAPSFILAGAFFGLGGVRLPVAGFTHPDGAALVVPSLRQWRKEGDGKLCCDRGYYKFREMVWEKW